MQRIADIVAKENGQLWINHDKPQTDAQKKPPEFYDYAAARAFGPFRREDAALSKRRVPPMLAPKQETERSASRGRKRRLGERPACWISFSSWWEALRSAVSTA